MNCIGGAIVAIVVIVGICLSKRCWRFFGLDYIFTKELQQRSRKKYQVALEGKDIQLKISNLTQKYRQERKITGPSVGSPSNWPLYIKIHEILGAFRYKNIELCEIETKHEIFEEFVIIDLEYSQLAAEDSQPVTECSQLDRPDPQTPEREQEGLTESAGTSIAFEQPSKKKTKLDEEILIEIKQLNKAATPEDKKPNGLMKELNEIEKKRAEILENFTLKRLKLQQKLLEIAQNK